MSTFNDLISGGPKFSLWGSATFGGGGDTTSTTNTSALPEYAEPYYHNLMSQSEALANEEYIPYQGDRIALYDPMQEQAFVGAQELYDAGGQGFDDALSAVGAGTDAALNLVSNQPIIESTYTGPTDFNALSFTPEQLASMGIDPSGMYAAPGDVSVDQFTPEQLAYYSSPYMQSVVDWTKENAILDDQRAALMRDAEAVNAGAFGGDRRYVGDYLAEEGLMDRLSGIQYQGSQDAFENAQMQFERDRAARYAAEAGNRQAGLEASGMNLDALINSGTANQQALLEAYGLTDASTQFGAGLAEQGSQYGAGLEAELSQYNNQYMLDSINALYGGADLMGSLSETDQIAFLERLDSLYGMGGAQQELTQEQLNTAYEDFINQRDYERNSMTWLSGIMHGVPVSAESNTIEYQSGPSGLNQAVGSGIAGLGLYNALS